MNPQSSFTQQHHHNKMNNTTEELPDISLEYKLLKRKIKQLQEANFMLSREYSFAKKKIRTLTFERNLLLDNIGRLENPRSDSDSDVYSELPDTEDEEEEDPEQQQQEEDSRMMKPTKILKRLANNKPEVTVTATTAPKRSKLTSLSVKTRRVQPIDRDQDGKPKLPQQIGVLTVLNLGTIVTDRPNYHNERYIFPVGYTVSRTYPSMIDPHNNTVVTSTILDGGDSPRFHVVAADMPDEPIIANSATGAWTVIVRKSNEIRQRDHSNSASGPDYYGFKHPTIANLIQALPGARSLKQYVWQTFEEMEPRAAKGVMAAAEKKRGNLEQMGNANRKQPEEGGDDDEDDDEDIIQDHF
ncbi:F/Y-rich N-terminus-domain-containing protein [Pilaira anomala]|nr:F/Y-rich N-terminus-domain-containing protein [Pilaira anomala]